MAVKKASAKKAVRTSRKRPATKMAKAVTQAKADLIAEARKAKPGKKLRPTDIFTASADLRLPASVILGGLRYGNPRTGSWVEIDSDYADVDDGNDSTD